MEDEISYRGVPGWPGYRAGSDGSIWSLWTNAGRQGERWKRLKLYRHRKTGYLQVTVRDGGKKARLTTAHRLVLLAFHGAQPANDYEARHLNGDRSDNRPSNLCWGTKVENAADRIAHGRQVRGERATNAKLTESAVLAIHIALLEGRSQNDLARSHRVSAQTIWRIAHGLAWRWLTGRTTGSPDTKGDRNV